MTIIKQFFSKIFDRLFPKLQEGDIVRYRGQKQRIIKSWYEMYFDNNYRRSKTQMIVLSCHGQLPVTMDNRLLIKKLGHEPIHTFKIGDQVSLKELEVSEWYQIEGIFGVGALLTSKQILDLSQEVGTVVEIDAYLSFSGSRKEPTIHVRFGESGYEILLHTCFLDKVPDYDII